MNIEITEPDAAEIDREQERLYAPMYVEDGMDWRELNMAISKCMQNYCGAVKNDALLQEGLALLESYERDAVPKLSCANPHDLMRTHEVMDILTVAKLIINACMLRKSSSKPLCFERSDYPEMDPAEDRKFITIRQEGGEVVGGEVPHHYFGDIEEEYIKRNGDYIEYRAAKYGDR